MRLSASWENIHARYLAKWEREANIAQLTLERDGDIALHQFVALQGLTQAFCRFDVLRGSAEWKVIVCIGFLRILEWADLIDPHKNGVTVLVLEKNLSGCAGSIMHHLLNIPCANTSQR